MIILAISVTLAVLMNVLFLLLRAAGHEDALDFVGIGLQMLGALIGLGALIIVVPRFRRTGSTSRTSRHSPSSLDLRAERVWRLVMRVLRQDAREHADVSEEQHARSRRLSKLALASGTAFLLIVVLFGLLTTGEDNTSKVGLLFQSVLLVELLVLTLLVWIEDHRARA